jgi:ribosome biogenesis GTPase / thiamine phosphate phosphatase
MDILDGQVIRSQSGFFWVQTAGETLVCQLRGRLKQGARLGDVAAVGDRVIVSKTGSGEGMIEEVKPRQRALVRLAPTPRGTYQQVIIANPDQAVFTFACARPEPHLGMLDRFLVIAEKQGLPANIVANKVDLTGMEHARELFDRYPPLGYPVIYTSVKDGTGIGDLRVMLTGKLSVFAGPSGAGKSSLLNTIEPGLGLAVRDISQATEKGRHTTVVRQMFRLKEGGYFADTPGLKALALFDIKPEELDAYFPDLRNLVSQCQFNDCTHTHEPGCAVLDAVANGSIHPGRYESYRRMRLGEEVI